MKIKEKDAIKEIQITGDPLVDIQTMAPYLDEEEQKNVFWLIFGLTGGKVLPRKDGNARPA